MTRVLVLDGGMSSTKRALLVAALLVASMQVVESYPEPRRYGPPGFDDAACLAYAKPDLSMTHTWTAPATDTAPKSEAHTASSSRPAPTYTLPEARAP